MSTRLAVLGSPVSHSLSPALHRAAYQALGLDWAYEAVEVTEPELAAFLGGSGRDYRGFSVTMPLKAELARLADHRSPEVDITGVANTVIGMAEGTLRVFNTDIAGIVAALTSAGCERANSAIILGSGATAMSALLAAQNLGVQHLSVVARSIARATALGQFAEQLGINCEILGLEDVENVARLRADLLISTLPARVVDEVAYRFLSAASFVLDVAYAPEPRLLAQGEGRFVSGLEMLLEQAVIQVRVFVSGEPSQTLSDEEGVRVDMRRALPALWKD